MAWRATVGIVLSEVSQTETNTIYMMSLRCGT